MANLANLYKLVYLFQYNKGRKLFFLYFSNNLYSRKAGKAKKYFCVDCQFFT